MHPTFVLVAFDNWLINENTTTTIRYHVITQNLIVIATCIAVWIGFEFILVESKLIAVQYQSDAPLRIFTAA